jgi:hypothetical protein
LITRLDQIFPMSSTAAELGRALRAAAECYAGLLADWADRTGRPRPASALEPGVFRALALLPPAQ